MKQPVSEQPSRPSGVRADVSLSVVRGRSDVAQRSVQCVSCVTSGVTVESGREKLKTRRRDASVGRRATVKDCLTVAGAKVAA